MFKDVGDLYIENEKNKDISKDLKKSTMNVVKDTFTSFLEGSLYFLYGYYHCYSKINGYEIVNDEVFLKAMEEIKGKEDLKNFLEDNINEPVYKFFHWYLYERG